MENNGNVRSFTIAENELNQTSITIKGNFSLAEFMMHCNTAVLNMMKQVMTQASQYPEMTVERLEELKGELYDMYNVNASNVLRIFAPEIENHPDITVQAILEQENKMLEEQIASLKREGKVIPFNRDKVVVNKVVEDEEKVLLRKATETLSALDTSLGYTTVDQLDTNS